MDIGKTVRKTFVPKPILAPDFKPLPVSVPEPVLLPVRKK